MDPARSPGTLFLAVSSVGSFLKILRCPSPEPAEYTPTFQEHLLAAPTQAPGFIFPQRPKVDHRLISEHSVPRGSKGLIRLGPGRNPKIRVLSVRECGLPTSTPPAPRPPPRHIHTKSAVHFRGRTGCWVTKTNIRYKPPPRTGWDKKMGKENLSFQICQPFSYKNGILLIQCLFNWQRHTLHNSGEMIKNSPVCKVFIFSNLDECQRD